MKESSTKMYKILQEPSLTSIMRNRHVILLTGDCDKKRRALSDLFLSHGGNLLSGARVDTERSFLRFQPSLVFQSSAKT